MRVRKRLMIFSSKSTLNRMEEEVRGGGRKNNGEIVHPPEEMVTPTPLHLYLVLSS